MSVRYTVRATVSNFGLLSDRTFPDTPSTARSEHRGHRFQPLRPVCRCHPGRRGIHTAGVDASRHAYPEIPGDLRSAVGRGSGYSILAMQNQEAPRGTVLAFLGRRWLHRCDSDSPVDIFRVVGPAHCEWTPRQLGPVHVKCRYKRKRVRRPALEPCDNARPDVLRLVDLGDHQLCEHLELLRLV